MNHIRIYHSIWNMKLSPNAFRTYCAILRFMNTSTNYANVNKEKLAESVCMSTASISRGIKELQNRKLIQIIRKSNDGRKLANGYVVERQEGRFTMLPFEALTLPVSSYGLMIYTYLLKCADKAQQAFPSLSAIAEQIGCTVKTVVEQIKALTGCLSLHKKKRKKLNGAYKNNRYRLFQLIKGCFRAKEKTRCAGVSNSLCGCISTLLKVIVAFCAAFVKHLFSSSFRFSWFGGYCKRGCCNFDTTSTIPTQYYKRKRRITLYCRYNC